MKNSNSSLFQKEILKGDQSQNQLPQQWGYLSKRLTEVQKGLTLVQKRFIKLEKKINNNVNQTSEHNAQLIEQILSIKKNMTTKTQVKEDLSRYIQNIQSQIKNVCSNLVKTRLETTVIQLQEKYQNVQFKVKTVYDQTKSYVDRAIHQLKQLLKKYVKQQGQLQRKMERTGRQNSPSLLPRNSVTSINSLSKSKSAKKLFQNNEKSQSFEKQEKKNDNWFQKSKQILSKQNSSNVNGTNRVSYLREKLKQFEKVNKKYQQQSEKNSNTKKQQKQQLVKKMKNYRQYLQQTESQIQPSNILSQEAVGYPINKKGNFGLF